MIKTSISAIIVFSLATALLFYYFADRLTEGLCSNKIYREYLSPDRSLKAVVFQRDCGATTGFTTQISIIESHESLENSAGNLFVVKRNPKVAAPEIEWKSDKDILIHYLPDGTEVKAKTKMMLKTPLKITYQ